MIRRVSSIVPFSPIAEPDSKRLLGNPNALASDSRFLIVEKSFAAASPNLNHKRTFAGCAFSSVNFQDELRLNSTWAAFVPFGMTRMGREVRSEMVDWASVMRMLTNGSRRGRKRVGLNRAFSSDPLGHVKRILSRLRSSRAQKNETKHQIVVTSMSHEHLCTGLKRSRQRT